MLHSSLHDIMVMAKHKCVCDVHFYKNLCNSTPYPRSSEMNTETQTTDFDLQINGNVIGRSRTK